MAVDSVPWFVAAPAEHSAEVARTLAYQAIGGKEGLARSGDLLVRAMPVPGGAVQVLPGAAGILNRAPGGGGQAYVGRVGAAVSVPIAATGSGAGRTDLIVFRVDDPQYGGTVPPSAEKGPYIRLDVISGVNAAATRVQDVPGHETDSAVTLARVTLPASTGTVTSGMVRNLAAIANPNRERAMLTLYPTGAVGEGRLMPSSAYASWPLTASERPSVAVPEWARTVRIACWMMGIHFSAGSGDSVAGLRTGFGGTAPGENTILKEDGGSSAGRHMYGVVGTHDVPESHRGTNQLINIQGVRTLGTGLWRADYQSSILIDYEFSEV